MAGAGKSFAHDQPGKSALPGHNQPRNLPEGFDGPSNAQSNDGRPSHGFGAGVGYDPARDNPAPARPQIATLFELPAGAYRDPSKHVSYTYIYFFFLSPVQYLFAVVCFQTSDCSIQITDRFLFSHYSLLQHLSRR